MRHLCLSKPKRNGHFSEQEPFRDVRTEKFDRGRARCARRKQTHDMQSRNDERNDRREDDRDADDELAALVHLVVRPMDDGEGDEEREEDQTERPEHRMPDAPFDRAAQRNHGR
jgi:hypothetical protein